MSPGGGTTVREALGGAVDALAAAGVGSPRLDAELLLAEATGWDRAGLVADGEMVIAPDAGRRFAEMVRRRLRREPVAYILGRRWFRHLELFVDRRVLIPRPETEMLVDVALELRPASLLDVGTGSGAIALAVASELPSCRVTATDTSAGALEVARANASRLGLADRVRFMEATLPPGERFELVLANLPYIAEPELPALQPELTQWEPPEAFRAGPEGLDAIRAVVAEVAAREISPAIALEVGDTQAPEVVSLLEASGFTEVDVRRDLAGIERIVVGRRSEDRLA